jgi:hypothetical protein
MKLVFLRECLASTLIPYTANHYFKGDFLALLKNLFMGSENFHIEQVTTDMELFIGSVGKKQIVIVEGECKNGLTEQKLIDSVCHEWFPIEQGVTFLGIVDQNEKSNNQQLLASIRKEFLPGEEVDKKIEPLETKTASVEKSPTTNIEPVKQIFPEQTPVVTLPQNSSCTAYALRLWENHKKAIVLSLEAAAVFGAIVAKRLK